MKNWSYTIREGEHAGETLWSGRYCAVAAFVFCKIHGVWHVLANQRGEGTPDFQGYWNCPCGYLDMEKAENACSRETFDGSKLTHQNGPCLELKQTLSIVIMEM